jgi:hypothetical protein
MSWAEYKFANSINEATIVKATIKHYLFLLLTVIAIKAVSQPVFNQEIHNRMLINPALTASDSSENKLLTAYEKIKFHYPQIDNLLATYQMQLPSINSAFGVMGNYNSYNQEEATFERNVVYWQSAAKAYYRYSPFSGFSIGIDGGIMNFKTDYYIDPFGYHYNAPNTLFFDADAGLSYKYKNAYLGFSLGHITAPQYTYYLYGTHFNIPNYAGMAYNVLLGYTINMKHDSKIELMGWYNAVKEPNINTISNTFVFSAIVYIHNIFFIGFSVISGAYPYDSFTLPYPFFWSSLLAGSAIIGANVFKDRLRVSFSLDVYSPDPFGSYPTSMQNIEGTQGFRF